MIGGEDSKRHISGKIAYLDSSDVASVERVFGERRLLACAPRRQPTAAITFSSIAMGVGNAVTSTVVRVGFGLPSPAKYTA